MATIILSENQVKEHIELLETMAQMLIKEADKLRNETKVGEAKVSKRKTKAEKEMELEIIRRRIVTRRYKAVMRSLKTPEDQQRLREFAKTKNIII